MNPVTWRDPTGSKVAFSHVHGRVAFPTQRTLTLITLVLDRFRCGMLKCRVLPINLTRLYQIVEHMMVVYTHHSM